MRKHMDVFKYDVSDINAAYKAHCIERGVTDGVMSRYRRLFPILVAVLVAGVVASTSSLWLPLALDEDYNYNWVEISAFVAITGAVTWFCTAICLGILMVSRRLVILERAGITVKQKASTPSIRDLFRVRREINRQYKAYCRRTGNKGYWTGTVIHLGGSVTICLFLPTIYLLGIHDPDTSFLLDAVIPSYFAGVVAFIAIGWLSMRQRWEILQEDRAGDSLHHEARQSGKGLKTLHTEVKNYLKLRPDFAFGTIFGLVLGMFSVMVMVEISPLFQDNPMTGRPLQEVALAMAWTALGITVGVVSGLLLAWMTVLLLWGMLLTRDKEALGAKYPRFDPAEGENEHIQ